MWTQSEVIQLIKEIESFCPLYGYHVALTGGLLYKEGKRKDADILFYQIRKFDNLNEDGLWSKLEEIGIVKDIQYGWVTKAKYQEKNIDFFFPEKQLSNDYPKITIEKILYD